MLDREVEARNLYFDSRPFLQLRDTHLPNPRATGMLDCIMKNRTGVIVLAVLCVLLVVVLFVVKKQASEDRQKSTEQITDYSNRWITIDEKLTEQQKVNVAISNDLAVGRAERAALTNRLTEASNALDAASTTIEQTKATLKATEEEVTKRNARIADLESQNSELDRQALKLSTDITNLTARINETQRKLDASEGDKAFLEKELQRLMGEKADLEKQFNDLTALRAQVARLREELNISRRLEWIRKGLFAADEQRGAQQLIQRGPTAPSAAPKPTRYDLNVEINADGSVRVIEPLTNRPAATNPPPVK